MSEDIHIHKCRSILLLPCLAFGLLVWSMERDAPIQSEHKLAACFALTCIGRMNVSVKSLFFFPQHMFECGVGCLFFLLVFMALLELFVLNKEKKKCGFKKNI